MTSEKKQYRLVTRSDFDGLVCAVLLKELEMINDILFVHPKDMQDGLIKITENDITTNLPYVPGCHMAFDHHESETLRNIGKNYDNYIIEPHAPSAARVVYNHFGGKKTFHVISEDMMVSVDKADSAQFTIEDVLMPKRWELLSFIMDSRTGLGRFRNFRISNYQLMMALIDYCKQHSIEEILELPDVKERVEVYTSHQENFEAQIIKNTTVYKNLAVLDLRNEEIIYCGNRFVIYGLFPHCNVSIHRMWNHERKKNVFATGKSIFNRTSKADIGQLMLNYGGGGHIAAGTCQIENENADKVLNELIDYLTSEEFI